MRIAYFVHQFPCFSEPFVMDQITGMIDRRQDVAIFADAAPRREPIHPQVGAYRLIQRTRYLPRLARSRGGLLRQALKTAVARPALLAPARLDAPQPWSQRLRAAARLQGYVWPAPGRFDLVHCQFGCVARKHWPSARLWGARLIVSFRGHDFSSLPRVFGPGMYRELFQQVDAVMAVCRYAASRLQALGCPPEKLVTHYSGTDVADFSFAERRLAPGEPLRLLSVARLEESKGFEYTLRAVADLVHRRRLDLRYHIVGSGSLRVRLANLVDELRLGRHVAFLGARPRPEVRDLLHQHHLFVLPSVTTADGGQEGIPGSVREAMATGMPVVSTWHSGIPELVEDGVSGFLVPERDAAGLADRLERLAATPGLWGDMGRAGRQHVARHFDTPRLNDRLHAFYQHVAAGGVPAVFEARERAAAPLVSA